MISVITDLPDSRIDDETFNKGPKRESIITWDVPMESDNEDDAEGVGRPYSALYTQGAAACGHCYYYYIREAEQTVLVCVLVRVG